MAKQFDLMVDHKCGHKYLHTGLNMRGGVNGSAATKWYYRQENLDCPNCQEATPVAPAPTTLTLDPTTPTGASRTGAVINALNQGWTEQEVLDGRRHQDDDEICENCGRRASYLMSSSHGSVCMDCYSNSEG